MNNQKTQRTYPTHLRNSMTGFLCGRTDAGNVGTFTCHEIVDCPDCKARMAKEAK